MRWAALSILLAVVAASCNGSTAPTITPSPATSPTTTTAVSPTRPPASTTTAGESASAVVSREFRAWQEEAILDYDFEYVLTREDGPSDAGRYRAIVRGGDALACYFDGVHSRRIPCNPRYYTIDGLFGRLVDGDARLADVSYDPEFHFPASIDHRVPETMGGPYSVEVLAFSPAEPIDWVAYVDEVVNFWQENHIDADSIDWDEAREAALRLVTAVPRQTNAHVALNQAAVFSVPGGSFLTALGAGIARSDALETVRRLASGRPEGELLEGLFGYVRVPVVDPNQWETYAQELAGSITELREAGTCGWVVDLRDFRFSDPARDLLGIGALLGDGLVATIESAAGQVEWRYEEGQVLVGGVPLRQLYEAADFDTAGLEIDAGPIEAGPQAIALLVSVESAASFSALWLAAQDGTRIFGELPSVGHSMINAVGLTAVLVLPDGAQASVVSARIDGDDRLQPAEVVLSIPDSGTDEVLQAALKWLRGKPCLQ